MLKIFLLLLLLLGVGVFVLQMRMKNYRRQGEMIWGVSFNSEYSQYLGLNPREVFVKILDQWQFRYIRLSAQWSAIEKFPGQYDWQDLDWLMNAAQERHATVMLAVGYKTPRWPECHVPAWVSTAPAERKTKIKSFIQAVVERYKNHPALETWQVENEPFLKFGNCEKISPTDLREEIALVSSIDPSHPIITTDSGELSLWYAASRQTALFGTTLYRVVWNRFIGYWSYNWLIPPFVYRAKLWFNNRDINTAYITELQAEPWIPGKPLVDTPLSEQFITMSPEQLKRNIQFADETGMPRAYLWGAEWWYWLETKGEKEIPDFIKNLKK